MLMAREYVASPGFSDYVASEFGDFAKAQTDAEIDAFIRDQSDTVDHPVGTVAMGKGQQGALDANLRVKGTKGLRVVDASAFVSTHARSLAVQTHVLTLVAAFHSVGSYARPGVHPC